MSERDDFGPGLRRERERRGISLQEISDKTKISASLFAAMERNDFSRWPAGIFRRSFLRAYAQTVGLDAETLVQRFVCLFPSADDDARQPVGAAATGARQVSGPDPLRRDQNSSRPVLRVVPKPPVAPHHHDSPAQSSRRSLARPLAATAVDLGVIAALALAARILFGWLAVWPVVAVAAALVFVVSNLFLQATFGAWLVRRPAPPATIGPPRSSRARSVEPHQVAARRHQVRRVERQRSRH